MKTEIVNRIEREYPALDGIRGLAITLVILAHIGLSPTTSPHLFPAGVLGVDIFLVLSGFLITCALLKDFSTYRHIRLRRFYTRRVARIVPGLLFCLLGSWACSLFFPDMIAPRSVAIAAFGVFTFSLNFWMIDNCDYCHPLSSLWSLSVEEQFYLILPLTLILLLNSRSKKLLVAVATMPFLISLWSRYPGCFFPTQDGCWAMKVAHGSASRFMGQSTGTVLAFLWSFGYLNLHSPHLIVLAKAFLFPLVLYLALSPLNSTPTSCIGFDVVCLGTIGMIILGVSSEQNPIQTILKNRFLRYSGTISYGLYLWHSVTIWISGQIFPDSTLIAAFAGVLSCYLLATLSFYLLERPVLRRVSGMLRNTATQAR